MMRALCFTLLLTVAAIPAAAYPHHDCETYCDLTCQDLVHQMHDNALLPLNCTNGAPGTGAQANYCDNFYNNKNYHVQICGNGAINGNQAGCSTVGTLVCPKASGLPSWPSFEFECSHNSQWGGAPVQTVDHNEGICTWPNGYSATMMCNGNGGIIFGMQF